MNKGWQNQWMKNKRDRHNRPNKTRSFVDPMFQSILTPMSLMHRFQDLVVVKLETSETIYIFMCVWNTKYHYYPITKLIHVVIYSYSVITVIFMVIFLLLRLTKRGSCCCCCCCCTLLVKAFVGLLGYTCSVYIGGIFCVLAVLLGWGFLGSWIPPMENRYIGICITFVDKSIHWMLLVSSNISEWYVAIPLGFFFASCAA